MDPSNLYQEICWRSCSLPRAVAQCKKPVFHRISVDFSMLLIRRVSLRLNPVAYSDPQIFSIISRVFPSIPRMLHMLSSAHPPTQLPYSLTSIRILHLSMIAIQAWQFPHHPF